MAHPAFRGLAWVSAALLLLPLLLPLVPVASAACPGPAAWFVGVVYDPDQRDDFKRDVQHFEHFLSRLQGAYCIPSTQAAIYAFENNYTDGGKVYPAATEAAVKAKLAQFGAQASGTPGATLFFFLSSHGFLYDSSDTSSGCPARMFGSFSALKSGSGQDGTLHDCELGATLNSAFAPAVRIVSFVDCSLCGGFSDSLTAASGTVPDTGLWASSGIPRANRIAMTGCAMTTECFGGNDGAVSYDHMRRVLSVAECDGWTAPGFPGVQGLNVPTQTGPTDGRCSMSEWFHSSVHSALLFDLTGIQQQFRMKYGFGTLAEDIRIL